MSRRSASAAYRQIARWTGKCGDAASALNLYNEPLPDEERTLGPDHPTTGTTRHEVAYQTAEWGRVRNAAPVQGSWGRSVPASIRSLVVSSEERQPRRCHRHCGQLGGAVEQPLTIHLVVKRRDHQRLECAERPAASSGGCRRRRGSRPAPPRASLARPVCSTGCSVTCQVRAERVRPRPRPAPANVDCVVDRGERSSSRTLSPKSAAVTGGSTLRPPEWSA